VKMHAWEVPLLERIRVARGLELTKLGARKYLDALCVLLWATTPVLIALTTFGFVLVFHPRQGASGSGVGAFVWGCARVMSIPVLTWRCTSDCVGDCFFSASTVFTALALLNLLIFPMNAFPWVLTGCLEAWVSLKRLERFLLLARVIPEGQPPIPSLCTFPFALDESKEFLFLLLQ
jgi:ATP-binding cassette, subfamily C (CFTR/MRP), member 10